MSDRRILGESLRISQTTHQFEGHGHGAGVSFFLVDYPPGRGTEPHRHPYAEVFVVESGEAAFTLDGEDVTAAAGEGMVVPAGAAHSFEAAGEGLRMEWLHAARAMGTERV